MTKYVSILFLLVGFGVQSQELNCRVVINAQRIQSTERNIFTDMETAFAEFLNNRKWTEDEFEVEERINCNLIITLDPNESQPSAGRWGASVQILSSRPVYNSGYETVLFNFADRDWQFDYVLSQPLQFNENSFTNNITSLLAFYAYTIIGLDYDSFGELDGTRYYQTASQIISNAQNSNYPGWSQFNSVRNRYWLNENLLSSTFEPLRVALYNYHLQGLDIFMEEPEIARNNILNGLKQIQVINRSRPRAILTISFLDAKKEELAQIFSKGNPTQKKEAYEILTKLDPGSTDTFEKILK